MASRKGKDWVDLQDFQMDFHSVEKLDHKRVLMKERSQEINQEDWLGSMSVVTMVMMKAQKLDMNEVVQLVLDQGKVQELYLELKRVSQMVEQKECYQVENQDFLTESIVVEKLVVQMVLRQDKTMVLKWADSQDLSLDELLVYEKAQIWVESWENLKGKCQE